MLMQLCERVRNSPFFGPSHSPFAEVSKHGRCHAEVSKHGRGIEANQNKRAALLRRRTDEMASMPQPSFDTSG